MTVNFISNEKEDYLDVDKKFGCGVKMITKEEFCSEIARRGERIDVGKIPKGGGFIKGQWMRYKGKVYDPGPRWIDIIFYSEGGAYPTSETARCGFQVRLDVKTNNPPTVSDIEFRAYFDGTSNPPTLVETAPDATISWIGKLPFIGKIEIEKLEFIDAVIEIRTGHHPTKVHYTVKNTGTIPVRPIIPIYLDGDYVISKQPLGSGKLGVGEEVSGGHSLSWDLSPGERTVTLRACDDKKVLAFTEPFCGEGELECKGTDLYECRNEQWALKEKNSPKCGSPAPTPAGDITRVELNSQLLPEGDTLRWAPDQPATIKVYFKNIGNITGAFRIWVTDEDGATLCDVETESAPADGVERGVKCGSFTPDEIEKKTLTAHIEPKGQGHHTRGGLLIA